MTISNLKTICAFERASILEKALSGINKEEFTEDAFKELVFNRITNFEQDWTDFLDGLDTEYYNIENEDIEKLLSDFWRIN